MDRTFRGLHQSVASAPSWRDLVDLAACGGSGLIYGALIGLGAGLYALLQPYKADPSGPSDDVRCLLLPITFGVPWAWLSQLMAEIIFIGSVSYERNSIPIASDLIAPPAGSPRNQLSGRLAHFGFGGAPFAQTAHSNACGPGRRLRGIITVASGIVTALLGRSAKTVAKTGSKSSRTALIYNIVLAVTGPIFVAGMINGLSIGLDAALFDDSLIQRLLPVRRTRSPFGRPGVAVDRFWRDRRDRAGHLLLRQYHDLSQLSY